MNRLLELKKMGQSIWLDYIRRNLITSGELKRLIGEDGLMGVTSNPTIFEKAVSGSSDYDEAIKDQLEKNPHTTPRELYELLVVEDIQLAADTLRPIYDETGGRDGFVSLELSPNLAYDTEGSLVEARYFWGLVNRPNVMLKVPATREGMPVVEQLISEEINVNITLMFSMDHYEAVAEAYIRGLERCGNPSKVASVASFFVSRVDTKVDKELTDNGNRDALSLKGRIAIANSKAVYQRFKEVFSSERWKGLEERGGRVQRVLWASTGTKDPEYSDVLYLEELIAPDTVNTVPPATLNAFRNHGRVAATLERDVETAMGDLEKLGKLRIDLARITDELQTEGAEKFIKSYEQLITALKEKTREIGSGQVALQTMHLGKAQEKVDKRLRQWQEISFGRRLAEKDPTLWFSDGVPEITNRLGWFDLPESMHEQLDDLASFAEEIRGEGFKHAVLLGMGGSSLAPEVFQKTFGNKPGYPELIVLDSTHPDAVKDVEKQVDLGRTLFIVASKSGKTLEPLSFHSYFWGELVKTEHNPAGHFIAITDPGSPLAGLAAEKGFRRVFYAQPDLGGRYSALTTFGLLPAALIGVDVHRLLDKAWVAKESCAFCVEETEVLGLRLGAALGELALLGKDKVTFFSTPSISSFPGWLEQLIAESTGKEGRGILPVVGEPLMPAEDYGDDRVFVYFRLKGEESDELKDLFAKLQELDHPTIEITLNDKMDIAGEMFKWEVAVAAAGSILGIHPFNQPDVELAKKLAREAMDQAAGSKPPVDEVDVASTDTLGEVLKNWAAQAKKGDYVCVMAYLNPSKAAQKHISDIRKRLLKRLKVPVTVGFGPRFLHSTGQLHKGGPNTGLFLQIVDEPEADLPVPGTDHTFKPIIEAQSIGDYMALRKKDRRVLRINLGSEGVDGLLKVSELIKNL